MSVEQLLLSIQLALLISERILCGGEIGLPLAVGRAHSFDLQAGIVELGLRLLDRGLVGAVVEPDQHLALLHVLVVVDFDADHPAADIGGALPKQFPAPPQKVLGLDEGTITENKSAWIEEALAAIR